MYDRLEQHGDRGYGVLERRSLHCLRGLSREDRWILLRGEATHNTVQRKLSHRYLSLFLPFDRDGVTHRYTPWRSPSSSQKTRRTSSTKSVTLTNPTRTARRIKGSQEDIALVRQV